MVWYMGSIKLIEGDLSHIDRIGVAFLPAERRPLHRPPDYAGVQEPGYRNQVCPARVLYAGLVLYTINRQ